MADWDTSPDDWEEEDFGEEDSNETIPCPHCQRPIHEDSQRCPYCELYLSEETAPPTRKPWWIILGVLLCLYVVYQWVFGWIDQ